MDTNDCDIALHSDQAYCRDCGLTLDLNGSELPPCGMIKSNFSTEENIHRALLFIWGFAIGLVTLAIFNMLP